MKILIPMVHSNSELQSFNRMSKALYEVGNNTVLQHIIEKTSEINSAEYVFVINESDIRVCHLDNVIKRLAPNSQIIVTNGKTKGAACSCLMAIEKIDENEPMVIFGMDKYFDIDLNDVINSFVSHDYDGGVLVFEDINPRWSYVKLEDGLVIEAAEKNPISKTACAGLYYFKKASFFWNSAMKMIKKDNCINDQFYIAPALNEMILENRKIGIYQMEKSEFFSLSSEKGIELFENHLKIHI